MGTILASTLIAQAAELVQDESNVVWTQANGLGWLNDGQRAVVMVRPDASVISQVITLDPGTKQAITGNRLMSITRNMGADGATPGRAVRLVERGVKDDFDPDWHTETAATEVKEYIYDARTPKLFYVSPPVHAVTVVTVEDQESVTPDEIAAVGNTITVDDIYSSPLIEWIAYRYLSRDSEETPGIQRAAMHFQSFFALLGAKTNPDMAINPKVREHLK